MTLSRDPEKARTWQQRSAKRAAEKRRAAPKQTKPSARAKPKTRSPASPKPGKRLPARNSKRSAARRLEQFGTPEQTAMIRAMPCCCSRAPRPHPECTGGWSEPSHIVTRGAGGKKQDQVAHSTGCHTAFHQHGRETWCLAVGWTFDDLRAEAARTWAAISSGGMPDAPDRCAPS